MFTVYDTGRKATWECLGGLEPSAQFKKEWGCCEFDTYEEAIVYADNWLGIYSPGINFLTEYFKNNQEYGYSGYGNTVEIREEE